MDTPLALAPAPLPVQIRREKEHKIDLGGSPPATDDLDHAVDMVLNDVSLPAHLRTVILLVGGDFHKAFSPKSERDRYRGLRLSRSPAHTQPVSRSVTIASQPMHGSQPPQMSHTMSPNLANSCVECNDPMIPQSSENA
ncbi:hypothetical protein Aduo_005506 [Ancylostoma duodenale]